MKQLKLCMLRIQTSQRFSFKPGVGPNKAWHSSPSARNCTLLVCAMLVQSTLFVLQVFFQHRMSHVTGVKLSSTCDVMYHVSSCYNMVDITSTELYPFIACSLVLQPVFTQSWIGVKVCVSVTVWCVYVGGVCVCVCVCVWDSFSCNNPFFSNYISFFRSISIYNI